MRSAAMPEAQGDVQTAAPALPTAPEEGPVAWVSGTSSEACGTAAAATPGSWRGWPTNRSRGMSFGPWLGPLLPVGKRMLGSAGRQVFLYDGEPGVEERRRSRWSPCRSLMRPRLWWLLLGIFTLVIAVLLACLFLVWYLSVQSAVMDLRRDSEAALMQYSDVARKSVDSLTSQLGLRDMEAAKLAVAGYLDIPFLAVEMLGTAMQSGYMVRGDTQRNMDYLWGLYRTLPLLQSESSTQRQPRLEGVFFADRAGTYLSFANQCTRPAASCVAESVDGEFSYGFDYRPGEDADLNCSRSVAPCPPSGSRYAPGHINFYTADASTGAPVAWFGNKTYDPRTRPWYHTAAEAKGIAAWSKVYVDLLYEDGGHPDIGFSVSRAQYKDSQAEMVAGAMLTLRHMTDIIRQYSTHPGSCLFILELATGRMIANSDGFRYVVRPHAETEETHHYNWSESGHSLVIEAVGRIRTEFRDELSAVTEKGVLLSAETSRPKVIYSWEKIRHGNGAFALEWLLVNVHPARFYKGEIEEELSAGRDNLLSTVTAVDERLGSCMAASALICLALVLLGAVALACISRLVTQPLKRIARDMRCAAALDLDNIDALLRSDTACAENGGFWSDCRVQEVAVIRETFAQMAKGLRSFSRYMDPYVVQVLVQSRQEAKLGVAKADATIFFSDIANFTALAERVKPDLLLSVLSEYLDKMSAIIMKHSGVIGEFIGDGIMAWWNVPWELDGCHTAAGLAAALEQQHRLSELRRRWCQQGLPEVRARMGLVRGTVLAGNIGSHDRMKYGLVGDSVNLAARLESLCKRYRVQVLVDEQARRAPGSSAGFHFRPIDLVSVKGAEGATEVFELVACKAPPDGTPANDVCARFCYDFECAQRLYRGRRFQEALEAVAAYQQLWPDDQPARLLRERCELCVARPPGPDWSPVEYIGET